MRWKVEPKPRQGDLCAACTFLIFPLTLNGETRWLEKAFFEEVCNIDWDGHDYWEPVRWLTEEEFDAYPQKE